MVLSIRTAALRVLDATLALTLAGLITATLTGPAGTALMWLWIHGAPSP